MRRSVFGCAAVILVLAGAGSSFAQAQSVSADRGHDLLQHNCAGCHATGLTGESPNPISPPFSTLHLRYPVENLAEALAEGIIVGHPEMPQFKFSAEQVTDIITYLKTIQTAGPARN